MTAHAREKSTKALDTVVVSRARGTQFARGRRQTDAGAVTGALITCKQCGHQDVINDPRHMPADVIAKKLRERGWRVGKRRNADICQACVKENSRKKTASAPAPVSKPTAASPVPLPEKSHWSSPEVRMAMEAQADTRRLIAQMETVVAQMKTEIDCLKIKLTRSEIGMDKLLTPPADKDGAEG